MEINPELEECHSKGEFEMSSGKTIILEMKLELISINKEYPREFPEGYRFSWFACNKNQPKEEFVLFDNYYKPPHFHIDNKKEFTFFLWETRRKSETLFFHQVENKFGCFKKGIKINNYD